MRLAIVVVFLFACVAFASQPPTPTKAPIGRDQQQPAQAVQTQTSNNQTPTSTPLNQITIQQTNADKDGDSSSDNPGAGILSVLTLLVGGIQAWVAYKLNNITSEQKEIARKQNEFTETQTKHMLEGLDVAKKSADASTVAARAAADSAKVQKATMYLSLRARVNLDKLIVHRFEAGKEPHLEIVWKNYGSKGAELLDYCIVATNDPLPTAPSYPAFEKWHPINVPLEKGDTYGIDLGSDGAVPFKPDAWDQFTNPATGIRFKLYGAIRYKDGFGVARMAGFAREYDPVVSKRRGHPVFVTIHKPGYNYGDEQAKKHEPTKSR